MSKQKNIMGLDSDERDDVMNTKTRLGQFYTTNFKYILQDMYIPSEVVKIIEPFVGNGDLLCFIDKSEYEIEMYDIDPKIELTIKSDTLLDPPNYDNKFVITNPPYLARNKNENKEIYDKWNCNDLYKCFILHLINSECIGGIIIVPLNFITSMRKNDLLLRQNFMKKYHVELINIFEEQVFSDTSYTVCSLQFSSLKEDSETLTDICIYPSKTKIATRFTNENNYTIGGDIYNLPFNSDIKIERATKLTKNKDNITSILLKCIDDNIDNQIGLRIDEPYIDNTKNLSARSYATLVITPKINKTKEKELVRKFNTFISDKRKEYNSLFLTNYRESNSIARKRISFELAFKICNYLLSC